MDNFINLMLGNVATEHLCCAIADKKHQAGVDCKRAWLQARIPEGHVFRKLDAKGKVFIEYAPAETAWAPVLGDGFLYVYCLWVSGSFKGHGYGRQLLQYCIDDARRQGRSGVCTLSSKKKTPYLGDKKFFQAFGFEVVDNIGDYELLALSFNGSKPCFTDAARDMHIATDKLTVFYTTQCPYIANCIAEIDRYCSAAGIPLALEEVDSAAKAKAIPCVFNNWAVFNKGRFVTTQLLNEGLLKKMIG